MGRLKPSKLFWWQKVISKKNVINYEEMFLLITILKFFRNLFAVAMNLDYEI